MVVRQDRTGISPDTNNLDTALDCFLLLLNNEIINNILKNVSDYATELCRENNLPKRFSIFTNVSLMSRDEFFHVPASKAISPENLIDPYHGTTKWCPEEGLSPSITPFIMWV